MKALCFGDSICHGYGVDPGESWVGLLRARCAALPDGGPEIINAGVNGDATDDGLRRMRRDVEERRPDLLYIQFGLNDCWIGLLPPPAVADNVRAMVRRGLACGARAVVVGNNHPVLFGEDVLLGGGVYPERVRRCNAALREAFAAPPDGVIFADLERVFLRAAPDAPTLSRLLQDDGLHLSREGNALYCEHLFPVLRDCAAGLAAGGA